MPTRKNLEHRKSQRQSSALERQEHWAGLSFEAQLASLDKRKLTATKQRARIAAAIVLRDAPKPEKKAKPEGKPRRQRRPKEKK